MAQAKTITWDPDRRIWYALLPITLPCAMIVIIGIMHLMLLALFVESSVKFLASTKSPKFVELYETAHSKLKEKDLKEKILISSLGIYVSFVICLLIYIILELVGVQISLGSKAVIAAVIAAIMVVLRDMATIRNEMNIFAL